jgi:biopolymer transport protein ExbD
MVVTDWLQEGRLLADDRVRPSGTAEWFAIGSVPTLAPYLPKKDEHRAEDQAEALEPVHVDFTWKRGPEDDDEDVDMIPLIDISLVLLIFFMMTAAVGAGVLRIDPPVARNKLEALTEEMKLWVGISVQNAGVVAADKKRPWYTLGMGEKHLAGPTQDIREISRALRQTLRGINGRVKILLRADQSLPIEVIKNMTMELKIVEFDENQDSLARIKVEVVGEVREAAPAAK